MTLRVTIMLSSHDPVMGMLDCLKADFQSSHEAPRSSLRVMHEHFHPITMLNS